MSASRSSLTFSFRVFAALAVLAAGGLRVSVASASQQAANLQADRATHEITADPDDMDPDVVHHFPPTVAPDPMVVHHFP